MKRHHQILKLTLLFFFMMILATNVSAEKSPAEKKQKHIKLPSSVTQIDKENTFTNSADELPRLQPSSFTKELLKTSKVKIENPNLIRLLNESAITKSPFSFGARATIYLGEWPLHYESLETTPNWNYQKVNTNYHDNRGGTANYQIHYVQEAQKAVKGGLTAKVPHVEDVQNMILQKAKEKTKLPLSFEAVVGSGTKQPHVYNIPPKRVGYLYASVPALHEKGTLNYGEVYLVIKGSKQQIAVKNLTAQEIGAWLPLQDHLTFSFETK